MWYNQSAIYQIFPLGLCGAPAENDGQTVNRIGMVSGWAEHIRQLGCDTVFFGPLFDSDTHGYNTRNFGIVDCRLGRNADFIQVCHDLHAAGLRIIVDGVFNHVGRGFWAFQDVQKNREASIYRDWFFIDFNRDSNYGDGFWYEGWEGHFDLIRLNLLNPQVVEHIFENIRVWIELFGIDGIRLDVAYLLDHNFLRKLRQFVTELRPEFFLLGEMIHGDYRDIANSDMLHSATNYECYKGLYSSFNSNNMFEIAYSLNRQFGPEQWTLYKGMHLVNFADNHDVDRLASVITNRDNLPLVYGLMYAMPGIPCIYYGSEWGIEGVKTRESDANIRPAIAHPQENELTRQIARFANLHRSEAALYNGDYTQIHVANCQLAFCRQTEGERILVALNCDTEAAEIPLGDITGNAVDLIEGSGYTLEGQLNLPAGQIVYLKLD